MFHQFGRLPDKELLASFIGRDIISAAELSKKDIEIIMNTAAHYEKCLREKKRLYDMDGKLMAALFYEPSTRTRLSFETAMHRLGGSVVTVAESMEARISSTAKGETLHDSICVIDGYVDVLVCRSPQKGAAKIAADAARHPVINAGDGAEQHPTQALLDIYTIIKEKKSPDGLTVALIGDLKNGRTVHSLASFLSLYQTKLIFAAPQPLAMPSDFTAELRAKGIQIEETNSLTEAAAKADVLYMTRVQKERFEDLDEYERVKNEFIIDESIVEILRPEAIIIHPLPRVNEITLGVDAYPGAAYFRQAHNGVPVRMALLALVTGSVQP